MLMHPEDAIACGPCCICETKEDVRNVLLLDRKSPIPGRGWGCFLCKLASDGAIAVLCDRCLKAHQANGASLRFACRGHAGSDGRIPFEQLTGTHEHDLSAHLVDEAQRAAGVAAQIIREGVIYDWEKKAPACDRPLSPERSTRCVSSDHEWEPYEVCGIPVWICMHCRVWTSFDREEMAAESCSRE